MNEDPEPIDPNEEEERYGFRKFFILCVIGTAALYLMYAVWFWFTGYLTRIHEFALPVALSVAGIILGSLSLWISYYETDRD